MIRTLIRISLDTNSVIKGFNSVINPSLLAFNRIPRVPIMFSPFVFANFLAFKSSIKIIAGWRSKASTIASASPTPISLIDTSIDF